jgi:N6-L-threonylcarbamoyladenine synthase
VIDKLAREGDPKRFRFKRPRFSDGSRDFSFSGIKTAVIRLVKDMPEGEIDEKFITDLAASFQFAVVRNLTGAIEESFISERHKSIFITGGVAVNSALRVSARALAERLGVPLFIPDPCYCTDNGIMVAALGARLLTEGKTAGLELDAEPDLKIGEAPGKRKSLRYRQ